MCNGCDAPDTQLRDLIARFEGLVRDETDPAANRRLRSALAELTATLDAKAGCGACGGDIDWADDPAPAPAG